MPARALLRGATGMKDRRPRVRRDTGEVEVLECCRGHGGNLRPVLHRGRSLTARFTDLAIGGIGLELEREEFERKLVKLRRRNGRRGNSHQPAQAGGELREL